MTLLPALLLAAAFDGEAALRHASALAALGPHPWGSPRARVAAEYVAAKFREVGLEEVRLQEFESHGLRGANVIGVLRAPGPEFVLVGSHHDSAPGAPGAYDAGGGVGVLIEAARVLSRQRSRPRTIVFVSFDGEEAWATRLTTTAGSRAYIRALGPEARNLAAAFVIEMCGWKGGTPVLHPIAYADPLRPDGFVISPAWLVRAAQDGARETGAPLGLGDPFLSWIYQPAVRTFRVNLYGDDLSFLQSGLPALFASDSSFTAYYPWYHQAADTADKIDAASLARMGRSVVGAVQGLGRVPRGPVMQPTWFSAFGSVAGASVLLTLAVLNLVPGLVRGVSAGGALLAVRLLHAMLFGVFFWRHPIPALWVFALPNLMPMVLPGPWTATFTLLPALALAGLGAAAWARGFVSGLWLAPWEAAIAVIVLILVFVRARRGGGSRGGRGRMRRAGLPRR